jgi:hypothetical protein
VAFGGALADDNRRQLEEDVEILRRLLKRTLSAWQTQAVEAARKQFAFSKDGKYLATQHGNITRIWDATSGRLMRESTSQPVQTPGFAPAEGVYLKGQGVVYTVTLPPTEYSVKAQSGAKSPSKPLSDWERARNEIRGTPSEPDAAPAVPLPTLADTTLKLLARNGHHFKPLAPGEKITVVVTFRQPVTVATAAPGLTPAGIYGGSSGTSSVLAPTTGQGQPMPGGSLSRPPASARDHELMGDLHLKQGRAQEAATAYTRALELKAGRASELGLYGKLAQAYLMLAGQASPPAREAIIRRAIEYLQRVQQSDGTQSASARMPGRLVVSARKDLLDQVGSGKITFSEFRQSASVEFHPALTTDKGPAPKGK